MARRVPISRVLPARLASSVLVDPNTAPTATDFFDALRRATACAGQVSEGEGHIIRALEAENIESRPVWKPMHLQPLFEGVECVGGDVAADLFFHGICLPSSSNLSD